MGAQVNNHLHSKRKTRKSQGVETMEITYEEYCELKNRVLTLEEQLKAARLPKKGIALAYLVKQRPISHIQPIDNKAIYGFRYSTMNSDAWLEFVKLAKIIHAPNHYYKARRQDVSWKGNAIGYMSSSGDTKPPKTIEELTEEQLAASVAMLDEMIEIYNRYYKKIHPSVLVNRLNDVEDEYHAEPVKRLNLSGRED